MAMPRPVTHTYQPTEKQKRLFPDISGNTINGLGETDFRRPTPVYWREPGTLAHSDLQLYFRSLSTKIPALLERYKDPIRNPYVPEPLAPKAVRKSPEAWSREAKEFALANEGDLVGVARMNQDWVFDDSTVDADWVIIVGVAMDYSKIAQSPPSADNPTSAVEVMDQYNRVARSVKALANWIRERGYDAEPRPGPMAGAMNFIPAALACGFGELGKHGSIINRQLGSCFRLGGVTTKMPLVADEPDSFGADEFCHTCRLCADACPPDAIFEEKQWVRGARKWYVDFDKCIPYFNDTHGCAICLAACPWSRPGVAPKLAEKLIRRKTRLEAV
jgi:NAD-dependent dihydropyrimidine dehydrogenase PreA subunit